MYVMSYGTAAHFHDALHGAAMATRPLVSAPVSEMRDSAPGGHVCAPGRRAPHPSDAVRRAHTGTPRPGRCAPTLAVLLVLATIAPALAHLSTDDYGSCCGGTVRPCEDLTDAGLCGAQPGCTWDDDGNCAGAPSEECGSMTEQACDGVPGCALDGTCVRARAAMSFFALLTVVILMLVCCSLVACRCADTADRKRAKGRCHGTDGHAGCHGGGGGGDRYVPMTAIHLPMTAAHML